MANDELIHLVGNLCKWAAGKRGGQFVACKRTKGGWERSHAPGEQVHPMTGVPLRAAASPATPAVPTDPAASVAVKKKGAHKGPQSREDLRDEILAATEAGKITVSVALGKTKDVMNPNSSHAERAKQIHRMVAEGLYDDGRARFCRRSINELPEKYSSALAWMLDNQAKYRPDTFLKAGLFRRLSKERQKTYAEKARMSDQKFAWFLPADPDDTPKKLGIRSIREWIHSSRSFGGQVLQMIAAEEIGSGANLYMPYYGVEDLASIDRDRYDMLAEYVAEIHRRAQKRLKNDSRVVNGRIKLFRGVKTVYRVESPLSSWSYSEVTAKGFAGHSGIVKPDDVEIERVLIDHHDPDAVSSAGHFLGESEALVIEVKERTPEEEEEFADFEMEARR